METVAIMQVKFIITAYRTQIKDKVRDTRHAFIKFY